MRISDWSSDVCSSDLRTVLEQVPSADSTDHESNGEVRRRDSVHQTIGKTGIENDVPPARPGQELTIGPHLEADRSVHPAVHGENPGRRNKRAQGDPKGRCKMQLFSALVHAEQHDPEKTERQSAVEGKRVAEK